MLGLLLVLLTVRPGQAVVRYVALGGTGSCSQATNPATPLGSIRSCVQCMASSDICEIASGTYSGGITKNSYSLPSGTLSNPTTLRAAQGATVTVRRGVLDDIGFEQAGRSHLRVERIIFDGMGIDDPTPGVWGVNGDAASSNWTFSGVTVKGWRGQGYLGYVENLVFEDCLFQNNGWGEPGRKHNIYWEGNGGALRRCIIEGAETFGIQTYPDPSNVVIERNIFRNNKHGAALQGNNIIFRNNIVYNNLVDGVYGYDGNKIYNNTIWNNPGWGVHSHDDADIRNNILFNNGTNLYCGAATCLNNYTSDPALVNPPSDFHLSVGSGAIGYGMALASDVPNDYAGLTRPQGGSWDAGAYEYSSGTNAAPTIAITSPTGNPTWSTYTSPLTTLAGTASDSDGTVSSVAWACPTCTPTSGSLTCTGCGTASATWTLAGASPSSIALSSAQANVVTVTVTDDDGATSPGTLTITYTPLAPTSLAFGQPPTATSVNVTIAPPVTCVVLDQQGTPITPSPAKTVTVALGSNPGGATLNGVLQHDTVGTTATFDDLQLTASGLDYTLTCNATGLTGATSGPFDVVPNPGTLTGSPSAHLLGRP